MRRRGTLEWRLQFTFELGKIITANGGIFGIMMILVFVFLKFKFSDSLKEWIEYILIALFYCASSVIVYTQNSRAVAELSFTFVNFSSEVIAERVESMTGFQFKPTDDVTCRVSVSNSGSVYPSYKNGYFLYSGGFAKIEVNKVICSELEELTIAPAKDEPGNPEYDLLNYIEEARRSLISSNQDLIAERIADCLLKVSKQ